MAHVVGFRVGYVDYLMQGSGELIRLYHGTDIESAKWIAEYGLDPARAFQDGGEGYFWCSPDIKRAKIFSKGTMSNKPTIVNFDLPVELINDFLTRSPSLVRIYPRDETHDLKFQSEGFSILNDQMSNVTLTDAITFTEQP